MRTHQTMPLVEDAPCIYCHRTVGEAHKGDCVSVVHTVRVKLTFEVDVDLPISWEKHNIEFWMNDGSWCADNAPDLIERHKAKHGLSCACSLCKGEFIDVVDDTPKLRSHDRPVPIDQHSLVNQRQRRVLAVFAASSEAEREQFLLAIRDVYCMHCGAEQPLTGMRCQCWNDD